MIDVDVVQEDPRWEAVGIGLLAERAGRAIADGVGLDGGAWEIAVLACDDARIADLNRAFRGKAVPTNVLSWPSAERGASMPGGQPVPPDPDMPELGDIAIAYDTCADEARRDAVSLADHATHLIVHGGLHLLGYDHETDEDAAVMERLETEILARMGVGDPYSAEQRATAPGKER